MRRIVKTASASVGAVGLAGLIMALQTSPDTAISNAGLWYQKITGAAPRWLQPASADTWATIIASLLLGALLLYLLQAYTRWKVTGSPRLHQRPQDDDRNGEPGEVADRSNAESRALGFVKLSETKSKIREKDIIYEAGLEFVQDARNVALAVEVFIAESSFSGYKWKRLRLVRHDRADRNRGDIEHIHLLELRVRQRPSNALLPNKKSILDDRRARLKVRVTVTAVGKDPYVEERLFLWKNEEVFPMPLVVPSAEQGDSIDFEEGECVLWAAT